MSEAYASLPDAAVALGGAVAVIDGLDDGDDGDERETARYEASATVAFRLVGEDLLLQDLERDLHFTLNEVGSQIWLRLCSGQSVAEVAAAITANRDADPAMVARDVDETVGRLVDVGLLRRADA